MMTLTVGAAIMRRSRLALRMLLRKLLDRAARAYVAGPELADAIGFARAIANDGLASTIAYWNGAGEDPELVHAACRAAIDGAAEAGIRSYVSCKAPALAMSRTAVASLAVNCRNRGIGLHFDSQRVEEQAPTLDLIERVLPAGAALGCTLPARYARSLYDAECAIALQLRVRVVKGQFADPAGEVDPRAGFLALIDRLAGRAAHVAVATHDPALAGESLRRLAARSTSAELEL